MSRVTTYAPTALLASRSGGEDVVSHILRELGFDAVPIDGRDAVEDFLEPISLCVVAGDDAADWPVHHGLAPEANGGRNSRPRDSSSRSAAASRANAR